MARATELDLHISVRIRQRRMLLGISQTSLARAVGVTFQQIQKYESGRNRISAGRLHQIAGALKLSVSEFFDEARWAGQSNAMVETYASTREGLELMNAFMRVSSHEIRSRFIRLITAIADREIEESEDNGQTNTVSSDVM